MSITNPATRAEFKQYILEKLGAPIIEINVTDNQVEISIEESLRYYADYHYLGTNHIYWSKTLDATDVSNKYLTTPESIVGITEIFSFNQTSSASTNMFSANFQFVQNMTFSLASGSILSYYMNKQQYELMSQMLVGKTSIRFNKHENKLHIDGNWNRYSEGDIIVADAYQKIDPDVNTDVWSDRWLLKYATARVKQQWGQNLSKYQGMQLPGGIAFSPEILREANEEVNKIEEEMLSSYSIPPRDVVA